MGVTHRPKGTKATNKPKRTGAWTPPEKIYADQVVAGFHEGWLDVEEGTTLRWLLSTLLHCDPKRVSKRMENSDYNGRKSFQRKTCFSKEELEAKRANLQEWKEKFEQSVEELRRARLGLFDCDGIISGGEEASTDHKPMAKAKTAANPQPAPSAAKTPIVTVSNVKATRDSKTDASLLAVEMTSENVAALLQNGNLGDNNQALMGLLRNITGLSNKAEASTSVPVPSNVAPQTAPQPNDLQGLLQLLGGAPAPQQASAQQPNMARSSSSVPVTIDNANLLRQIQQQKPAQAQPRMDSLGGLTNFCDNNSSAVSSALPQQVAPLATVVPSASVVAPALTIEDLLKQIQNQGATFSQNIFQPASQGPESQDAFAQLMQCTGTRNSSDGAGFSKKSCAPLVAAPVAPPVGDASLQGLLNQLQGTNPSTAVSPSLGSASNDQTIAALMTSLGCNSQGLGVSSAAPSPPPPLPPPVAKPQACVTFEDLLAQIQGPTKPALAQMPQAGNSGMSGQIPGQNKPAPAKKPQARSDVATLLTSLVGSTRGQPTASKPGFASISQDMWSKLESQVPPAKSCQGRNYQGKIPTAPMTSHSVLASSGTDSSVTNAIFNQMQGQSVTAAEYLTTHGLPLPATRPTSNGYPSTPSTQTQFSTGGVTQMLSSFCSQDGTRSSARQAPVPQSRTKQPGLAQQLQGLLSGASATQEDANLVNSLKRVLEQHESQSSKRFKVG